MNELASIITHFRFITCLPRATRSHFDKKSAIAYHVGGDRICKDKT
ncbi:hypothetical protein VB834_11350 [Limnoraphis robusta Tam1]|nr:hypothetical protein [Limnoraphis robusta]MEA5500015.1 hypothetical protein [Limnoraphis robusta BA-68 BA1]MEA5539628.1 hypothetical protein [Limnoraphis robusta Tam1]